MKKFVFTLFAVAALIACQSNNKQNQMTGEGEAVEIVGTDSTGLVDVFAYEGTVPTASGKKDSMDYLVIITQKIDSVNGVYQMTTTYITADEEVETGLEEVTVVDGSRLQFLARYIDGR